MKAANDGLRFLVATLVSIVVLIAIPIVGLMLLDLFGEHREYLIWLVFLLIGVSVVAVVMWNWSIDRRRDEFFSGLLAANEDSIEADEILDEYFVEIKDYASARTLRSIGARRGGSCWVAADLVVRGRGYRAVTRQVTVGLVMLESGRPADFFPSETRSAFELRRARGLNEGDSRRGGGV